VNATDSQQHRSQFSLVMSYHHHQGIGACHYSLVRRVD